MVESGEIDANYFQHTPYLEDFNQENGTHLVAVATIHVEPLGLYGGKQTSLDPLLGGTAMIEIQNLSKSYRTASGQVEALKDVSITIGSGDIYGIIGMSGAGKSTLVRCINMLERPSQGRVLLDGQDLGSLSPTALRQVRRNVTMIFQSFNLLMQRTCLGNVCFPLELSLIHI